MFYKVFKKLNSNLFHKKIFCKVHFCWFQSLCISVTTQPVSRLHSNIIKFTLGAVFHEACKSIIYISMYIIWLYLFQIWPKYMTYNTPFVPNMFLFVMVKLHFPKISPFFPPPLCLNFPLIPKMTIIFCCFFY